MDRDVSVWLLFYSPVVLQAPSVTLGMFSDLRLLSYLCRMLRLCFLGQGVSLTVCT